MAWTLLQTALGAGATQLSTSNTLCRQVIIQNNSAHVMKLGDSTVSATKGIAMLLGPGGGSFNSGAVTTYNSYLSDFWVFGTAADVVDIFYNT
jgi:hypothetical protein